MQKALWDKITYLAIVSVNKYREDGLGRIDGFIPEKLICGVLTSREELMGEVKDNLHSGFGQFDFQVGPIPFDFTDYYDREMGKPISRFFFSFRELVSPDLLARVKVFTNQIEEKYALQGNRRVNLDPGLISLKRLILASTKDNGRRVPLSLGIYGEITLVFIDGAFKPVPWTYPDYRSAEYLEVMKKIREIYKAQLKQP